MMTRRVTVWMKGRRTVPRVLLALTVVMLLASASWAGSVAAQDPVSAQTPVPPVASPPDGPVVQPAEPEPADPSLPAAGLGGGSGAPIMPPVGNAKCPFGIGNLATTGSNQVVASYVASPADGMGTVTVTVSSMFARKDGGFAQTLLDNTNTKDSIFSVSISRTTTSGVAVQTAANGTGPLPKGGALLTMTFSTETAFDVIVNGLSDGRITWLVNSEGGGCVKVEGGGKAQI